jgi:dTDP-4-dehydrorhamnose 3,5-epimerase
MNIIDTAIKDVKIFEPKVFGDERGFFVETFRQSQFDDLGLDVQFVQDNHSSSSKGVLRGLHYQIKQPQGKLVRVIAGEVYDVAVDIRENSSTYGKHVGVVLSAENKKIFWVPPGFAHGFMVLTDHAEFVYKCSEYYDPNDEAVLSWDDPELGINWPKIDGAAAVLSEKDKSGRSLRELRAGI